LAGAYHGLEVIPVKWIQGLALYEKIGAICDDLIKNIGAFI